MNEIEKLKEEHKAAMDTCTSIGTIVGPSDTMSLSQQVAAMKQQMEALAAENAGLKESRNNLAEFIHEELDADYPLNMDVETPATDAVIADIEARGVEKFSVEIADLAKCKSSGTAEILKSVGRKALEFAQQLRSGKGAA